MLWRSVPLSWPAWSNIPSSHWLRRQWAGTRGAFRFVWKRKLSALWRQFTSYLVFNWRIKLQYCISWVISILSKSFIKRIKHCDGKKQFFLPLFLLMHICKQVKTNIQDWTLETIQKCAYKILNHANNWHKTKSIVNIIPQNTLT